MLPYEDIARAITASHLSTPLQAAIWAEADELASDVADRLRPWRFDQAPVRRSGALLGYVTRSALEAAPSELVAALVDPVGDGAFVSTNAPVRIVVEALADRPLVFVVEGRHVTGFIVRADLNKHAARTHYYLLVADLELALVALLRRSYRRVEPLLMKLPSRARSDAKKRFQRDLETGTDLDLLSAVQFGRRPSNREPVASCLTAAWIPIGGRMASGHASTPIVPNCCHAPHRAVRRGMVCG